MLVFISLFESYFVKQPAKDLRGRIKLLVNKAKLKRPADLGANYESSIQDAIRDIAEAQKTPDLINSEEDKVQVIAINAPHVCHV